MVLLTMTPAIVGGLSKIDGSRDQQPEATEDASEATQTPDEVSLEEPETGKPISHGQIVNLWKKLRAQGDSSHSLEELLRGARIYIPPPAPKPEPTKEFQALMARLRREEEARSYERMVNPTPQLSSFHDHFPHAARSFAEVNKPLRAGDLGDDEVTYNEVHRQVMLIINFLVSIAGVAGTLWIAARWWSLPSRLFLTLFGSILVAIAEVAVYSGYVWRLGEASKKQSAIKEVKEVVETWVVGQDEDNKDGDEKPVLLRSKEEEGDGNVRKRRTERQEGVTQDNS